jgi:hypothetical protein
MQQTFQCYQCRATNYIGTQSCWNCGSAIAQQQQQPPSVYQQPVNYQQPYYQQPSPTFYQQQQPQRELNWFQQHINWTWVIVTLSFELLRWGFTLSNITFPIYVWILFIIIYLVSEIAVTLWALGRKSRSGWWVLFPIAVLLLSNNRIKQK